MGPTHRSCSLFLTFSQWWKLQISVGSFPKNFIGNSEKNDKQWPIKAAYI